MLQMQLTKVGPTQEISVFNVLFAQSSFSFCMQKYHYADKNDAC